MMGLGIAFLVLLALAGAAGKKAAPPSGGGEAPPLTPGGPDPAVPTVTKKGKSGTEWVTQEVQQNWGPGGVPPGAATLIDIFLPDGQLGSHPTYRVLRYSQNLSLGPGAGNVRFLAGTVPGVDQKVVDLAISDFSIQKAADAGKIEEMLPLDLQTKFLSILKALTVDPTTGKVTGPIDAASVQAATAFAGELERAGYPEAAATMRAYAQAAASLLKSPPKDKQIDIPGLSPDLVERVNRVIATERDPQKLRDLVAALKKVPQSPARDQAIQTIEALIVSIESQKSANDAIDKTKDVLKTPAPTPPAARTYTVQKIDGAKGPSGIAARFTGDGNRWRELAAANPSAAGPNGANWIKGKNFFVGQVLNLPASWPSTPGAPAPTPGQTPATPTPGPAPTPSKASTYTISATDGIGPKGPWALAAHYTGNGARWRELIAMNPTKRLRKDGSNFVSWSVGEVIYLPASWATGGPTPTATALPSEPAAVPSSAVPQGEPAQKTPIEMAADAVAKNLLTVQTRYGMPAAHGKEDLGLVKKFQALTGDPAPDGKAGPTTLARVAQQGISTLPLVMYWPKGATGANVIKYRSVLNVLADQADAAGDTARATELRASAARERGQGGIVGQMPA